MTHPDIKFLKLKKPKYFKVFDFLLFRLENLESDATELGTIHSTIRQIAESAKIPKTTVIRALSWLHKHQYIVIQSVKRGHTIFVSPDYL